MVFRGGAPQRDRALMKQLISLNHLSSAVSVSLPFRDHARQPFNGPSPSLLQAIRPESALVFPAITICGILQMKFPDRGAILIVQITFMICCNTSTKESNEGISIFNCVQELGFLPVGADLHTFIANWRHKRARGARAGRR